MKNCIKLSAPAVILIFAFLCFGSLFAQPKFTLEEAFLQYKFYPKNVDGINWMNDGRYYTTLETNGSESTPSSKPSSSVSGLVGFVAPVAISASPAT